MKFSKNGRLRALIHSSQNRKLAPWLLGGVLTVLLTLLMTAGISTTLLTYRVGDIARRNIKAPRDMRLEDPIASKALRQQVSERVLPRYDIDAKLQEEIDGRVRSAFEGIQKSLTTLSAEIRDQLLIAQAESGKKKRLIQESRVYRELYRSPAFHSAESNFARSLGGDLSPKLAARMRAERFASWIGENIVQLVHAVLAKGVVSDRRLYSAHAARGIVVRDIRSGSRVPLPPSYNPIELREVESFLNREAANLGLRAGPAMRRLLTVQAAKLIPPTLNFNNQATAEAQKKATTEVPVVTHVIKSGEMIVREGERITEIHLAKLNALERASREQYFYDNRIGTVILVLLFLLFAWTSARRYELGVLDTPKSIVLFCILLVGQASLVKGGIWIAQEFYESSRGIELSSYYFVIPLASASMLAAILQGRSTAILMAVMSAVIAGMTLPGQMHFALFALAGGVYAAINWKDYRKRTSVFTAGLMIGIANAVMVFGFNMQEGVKFSLENWMDVPLAFGGGIANIVVVSAVMPLLESVFKLTTDMKLLELSDQNHPLLRQLMLKAPGTYHHSLLVGNLAEEAAEAVGANPLLVRVGAYFHDVGKVVKPEYFIENQGKENRHDRLSPSMSALILISHVKEGIEMARSHNLPMEIIDLIRQHHGTSLIRFFYEKAKSQGGDAREEVYRYPGPSPQTREAGIMMLADMVEATSRSLSDTSPARLAGLVERVVQTAFTDGQLDECAITLRDLNRIQEAFLRVLAGIYHHRVVYPADEKPERKGTNGDSHLKPPKTRAAQPSGAAAAGVRSPGRSPVR
ncbi:MAG: HDIG domain-containing metalloprotein [bacterium]